ncbi:L,D-transpeptidase [Compostibacter hankyongensis]|uniref:L,D-transpeptidase family protein n=1 Tax=Compostibacter hankyongensis TaxID=1007089 RepID=A0ABP8FSD9_9BACT
MLKYGYLLAALTLCCSFVLPARPGVLGPVREKNAGKITAGPGDGRINPTSIDPDKVFLLIDKSSYRLYLYEDTRLLKMYKVVFGSDDLSDKRMQGDKRTPEGTFHISMKRYDRRWSRFMLLDYPNAQSLARFNARKARGLLPAGAKPGNGIGIHGVRPGVQPAIDMRINWTDGCIGMKNADVNELFRIVKTGTPVVIRR